MTQISTIIVAKNEADRITQTIVAALQVTAEVLVVDTGSTDNTVQVAEKAGAKVVTLKWQGYGQTKNAAVKLAQNDWILSLDADEVLSDELQQTIANWMPRQQTVYLLDRIINFQGQWIRYSGWYPDWVPRLYDRRHCSWDEAKVHEKLVFPKDYNQCKLAGQLFHYSFRSTDHFRTKTDEYALLAAQEWIESNTKPSFWKRWIGPTWKYYQMYFLYKGYKDGNAGKVIAQVLSEGVQKKLNYYESLSKQI